MIGHFNIRLKLRDLILTRHPKLIVEVGAGDGANTKLLAHLHDQYPFRLVSISDKKIDGIPGVEFIEGISYEKLKDFPDQSIGLCIIDTDHNYWTLFQELLSVMPKMETGGLVVMHDVDEFYYNTGMACSYWDDHAYPREAIEGCARNGGLGMAVIDFLHTYRGDFKLLWWRPDHYGAAVLEKVNVTGTQVIMPGATAVFAKPA